MWNLTWILGVIGRNKSKARGNTRALAKSSVLYPRKTRYVLWSILDRRSGNVPPMTRRTQPHDTLTRGWSRQFRRMRPRSWYDSGEGHHVCADKPMEVGVVFHLGRSLDSPPAVLGGQSVLSCWCFRQCNFPLCHCQVMIDVWWCKRLWFCRQNCIMCLLSCPWLCNGAELFAERTVSERR